jgi:hypothetical protein
VIAGALGVALAAASGSYHWRRVRRPAADDLAAFIRRRLSHLDLDPPAADQFAREYTRRFGPGAMGAHQLATLGGLVGVTTLRWVTPATARSVRSFERRTVSYFLRSTTYCREPRTSPVRFVGFPDPYEGPCANPFANLSP